MKTVQMQMALGETAQSRKSQVRDEFIAVRLAESPTGEDRLMETICGRENMLEALKRVERNKGAPGVDGMGTAELRGHLRRHWEKIKSALREGTHKPSPVRRKEIPKASGGVRLLGIPTVLDRLIQQAVAQVLTLLWDPTFSEYSYGFRPGRSAQMAIEQARRYVEDGYTHVVDIDLSKFFDRVNHDRLMARLASRIRDKRVLKLIRAYLNSGTLVGGVIELAGKARRKADPSRRCWPTSYSTNSTKSWRSGVFVSCVTQTTWQSTCEHPRRRNGSNARSVASSPADSSWWSTRRKAKSVGRGTASTSGSESRASWERRAPASMRKA